MSGVQCLFGYVTPLRCELKVREWEEYQAYHCGLCRAIQARYGQLPRLALNYDCQFLALLLAGINGPPSARLRRCGYKPLGRKRAMAVPDGSLNFAADVNVLLFYHKCRDDWQDERRLRGLLGSAALARAYRKARRNAPGADDAIRTGLAALAAAEQANSPRLDEAADLFATSMRGVLQAAPIQDPGQRCAAGELCAHIGRWVYWMDAWEDRDRDRTRGTYNAFLAAQAEEERAKILLRAALNEAQKAFDLLDLTCNGPLLGNIVTLGLEHRMGAAFLKNTKGAADEEPL